MTRKLTGEERIIIAQVISIVTARVAAAIARAAGLDEQWMVAGVRYDNEGIDRLLDELEELIQ